MPNENLFYYPEKSGLELVAELELGEAYEFDTTILLRKTDSGKLFVAHDAGCSCPTPFEDKRLEDLVPVEDLDTVKRFVAENTYRSDRDSSAVRDFLNKAKRALDGEVTHFAPTDGDW